MNFAKHVTRCIAACHRLRLEALTSLAAALNQATLAAPFVLCRPVLQAT
jgi:hypothetical protein